MTKVFIGGSRTVSRLSAAVRVRLDKIIEKRLPVVIGDANGADKAVQLYFKNRGYDRVEVFCMEGTCRNNLGNWSVRAIPSSSRKKNYDYYSVKDQEMTRESSIGLMLWDGKSRGTLANVYRLIGQGKKVVVYVASLRQIATLRTSGDLDAFVRLYANGERSTVKPHGESLARRSSQSALLICSDSRLARYQPTWR